MPPPPQAVSGVSSMKGTELGTGTVALVPRSQTEIHPHIQV